VTDNTYSSGAPGIGFFSQFDGSDAPLDADFGFTGLVVMDEPCSALGNMGNTLLLVKRGPPAQAVAHWSSLPGAVTYNLYEDTVKDGSFGTRTVSGRDGTAGQPFPWPAGDCLYYRIAAADACGEGPK
jgi:hypothetical protein